jgi:hypothetical protein
VWNGLIPPELNTLTVIQNSMEVLDKLSHFDCGGAGFLQSGISCRFQKNY